MADTTEKNPPFRRGGVHEGNVVDVFTYHAPTPAQQENYLEIRAAAQDFARVLLRNTPGCADQQASLRLLRECVMTANAAVALQGLV